MRNAAQLWRRSAKTDGRPPLEVFAAPLGLLDEHAELVWVTQFEDVAEPNAAPATAAGGTGPAGAPMLDRILDPSWAPAFAPPKLED